MMRLFKTPATKPAFVHLGRLVKLAKADGDFHHQEQKYIREIGHRNGLNDQEIDEAMYHTQALNTEIDHSLEARFNQLVDFVELMTKDGHICESEKDLFDGLAIQLGFNHLIKGILFERIERGLEDELQRFQMFAQCESLLKY